MTLSKVAVMVVAAAFVGLTSAFVTPSLSTASRATTGVVSRSHRYVGEVHAKDPTYYIIVRPKWQVTFLHALILNVGSSTPSRTTMMAGGMSEFNKNRAARKPGPLDLVVELQKPLGIVLEEDEKGNVYVKELSPAGNAMRVRRTPEKCERNGINNYLVFWLKSLNKRQAE